MMRKKKNCFNNVFFIHRKILKIDPPPKNKKNNPYITRDMTEYSIKRT